MTGESVFDLISSLWDVAGGEALAKILPRDSESLTDFYPRLKQFVAGHDRRRDGSVDPEAILRGEIVSMGEGSAIEAGAVIHESCRLVLGPRSRVRSGAVLRDEVVVGADCLIGVHCEVVRSVVLGPGSALGHLVFLADSIVGRDVIVAGHVMMANTTLRKGPVHLKYRGERIDSGRTYLGALVGDRVRLGASSTLCPGCVVAPGLALPPQAVLYGTIDSERRDRLMAHFFAAWGD
jgi:NDP-sugar pyrophosphorylase family protein